MLHRLVSMTTQLLEGRECFPGLAHTEQNMWHLGALSTNGILVN